MREAVRFYYLNKFSRHFPSKYNKLFPSLIDMLGPIYMQKICPELLVFSVTPLKIDQNTNQNRSVDKVQNQGNERI